MKAYINTKEPNPNAPGGFDSYHTQEVEIKTTYQPRKGQTASGYGSALPTSYMVKYNGRWQRVKAICYSNAATLYIGKKYNQCLTVTIEQE